jgi:hypothetical protein
VALVLAIEPDLRQSRLLERIVREHVHADLLLVDSPDAAVAALSAQIPDVILVSALLSPPDEEDLLEKVRSLDGARHLQTYTIPQLASTTADEEEQENSGFFSRLWRKKNSTATEGCDPDLFAQEILTFLARAQELKSQTEGAAAIALRLAAREDLTDAAQTRETSAPATEEALPETSAWASPFEWRPPTTQSGVPGRVEARSGASAPSSEAQPAADATAEPAIQVSDLDAEAEAQRLAAEAEARRKREEEEQRQREEAERRRLAAEAEARRKREEEEQRQREEAERQRLAAEAEARRKREEEEQRQREEAERQRLAAEAEARRKREEEEQRKREEAERQRLAAEAEARRRREEEERRKREEAERQRLAAEAEARRKREEEEQRKREEAERQRLAAEAEARRKREEEEQRQREEEAERERLAAEAEAAVVRAREEQQQVLAAAQALARKRREEKARKLAARRAARTAPEAPAGTEVPVVAAPAQSAEKAPPAVDPYSEFREHSDGPTGVLRLMPLAAWARTGKSTGAAAEPSTEPRSDLQELIARLSIPPQVAVVSYPRGCRIRRVRVPPPRDVPAADTRQPVIVSRRALQEKRATNGR